MIRYEVTVGVREDLRDAFERYFVDTHIPEILATGCFLDIRFDRSDAGAYHTVYHAATRAECTAMDRNAIVPYGVSGNLNDRSTALAVTTRRLRSAPARRLPGRTASLRGAKHDRTV